MSVLFKPCHPEVLMAVETRWNLAMTALLVATDVRGLMV
jgi:hypothetical protein